MAFSRSHLFTTALSSFLMNPVWSMPGDGKELVEYKGAPKTVSRAAPSGRRSPSPERSVAKVSSLKDDFTDTTMSAGTASHDTEVSDEEWKKIMEEGAKFYVANSLMVYDILPPAERRELVDREVAKAVGHKVYEDYTNNYFNLYKNIKRDTSLKFIKDKLNDFFIPLAQFIYRIERMFDEAKRTYNNKGMNPALVEKDYFPPIQKLLTL